MRRKWCRRRGVDRAFRLVCGLAITVAVTASVGGLSGCIRVSPHLEIEDCVDRFIDAAVAGDFWAVRELTVDRPEGWEKAIEAVAHAWSSFEIADVERSGDRALVRIVSEAAASSVGEVGEAAAGKPGRGEWIIALVRIEGIWLVDLDRTLAPH
jgi:hypothetical protein